MHDLSPEIQDLIEQEASSYAHTLSTLIDLARLNNKLKLHQLAALLGVGPRTLTEWRAGRTLPHNTKHIAIISLLARGLLRVEDHELVANPSAAPPEIPPSPFTPTSHTHLQKVIAAKSRPSFKDHVQDLNDALPHLSDLLAKLNSELGPSLGDTLKNLKNFASELNLSPDQAIAFFQTLLRVDQHPK